MHETLKNVFDPVGDVSVADRDISSLARQAVFQQHYPNAALRDKDVARCTATTAAYLSQIGYMDETVGVEIFDSLPISGSTRHRLTLGAKYDRLMVRPGEPRHLTILDCKTGTPGHIDIKGACIMLAIASRRFKDFTTFAVEYDFLNVTGLASRQVVTFAEAKEAWPTLKARFESTTPASTQPSWASIAPSAHSARSAGQTSRRTSTTWMTCSTRGLLPPTVALFDRRRPVSQLIGLHG